MGMSDERKAAYLALVGQTLRSGGEVIEYIGPRRGYDHPMVRIRCGRCGKLYEYPAYRVLGGRGGRCKECSRSTKSTTLCWDCANACDKNKCPWAGGKPRDDWEATPTKIERAAHGAEMVDSFHVTKCPGFVPDRRTE